MPGPYVPNPDNYPTSVTLFDDGTPPNEAQFNPTSEGTLDRTAADRAWLSSIAIGLWYAAVSPGGGGVNNAAYAWDMTVGRWVAALNEGGLNVVNASTDGGQTWHLMHTTSGPPLCIVVAQVPGYTLVFETAGGATTLNVDRVDVANNISSTNFSGIANVSGATADYFHDQVIVGANFMADVNLFVFVQTGGNFTGHWLISSDANGYNLAGSWFDMTADLPANFQGGANDVGQFLCANTTGGLRQAVAGDVQGVALCGATAGTDTPHLMKITANTPGPATIVEVTATLPAPGPAYIIGGFAYDTVNNLFGLLLNTPAAGSYLYSSPDLVTWTLVHHFGSFSVQTGGLACAGGAWAVWMAASSTSPDSSNRVLWSWNVAQKGAGSTWAPTNAVLSPFGTGAPGLVGQMVSNGRAILIGQRASTSSTVTVQVSLGAGLPPASGLY